SSYILFLVFLWSPQYVLRVFFFSSRRRHTRSKRDWSSDVCSSDLLSNINLELGDGDFVTVIGSNGAGKSTVLNTVAGKINPDTGTVNIAGRNVTRLKDFKRAKYVGRVFQDPMAGTAPDLTIEQNMALAERRGMTRGLAFGITKAKRIRFADELELLELGLETRLSAKVGLLSGGQRQALSLLM